MRTTGRFINSKKENEGVFTIWDSKVAKKQQKKDELNHFRNSSVDSGVYHKDPVTLRSNDSGQKA